MNLAYGLPALLALSCSLDNTSFEQCSNNIQCELTFGSGSTCGQNGYCSVPTMATSDCEVDPPAAMETPYDGIDNDCDPTTPDDDLDGDGVPLINDCDDQDSTVTLAGPLVAGVVSSGQVPTLCDGRCAGMTVLQGNVELVGPVTDLSGMSCVSEVAGSLNLGGSGVTTLEGLEPLTRIRGDVTIEGEPELQELTGLERLVEIDGTLRVANNPALRRVGGSTPALLRVGGDLEVIDNGSLSDESAQALESNIVVTGAVDIRGNGRSLDFGNEGFEEETFGTPNDWLVFPIGATNGPVAFTGDVFPDSTETFTARTGYASLHLFPPGAIAGNTTLYQEHTTGFSVGQEFELTGWAYVSSEVPLDENCLGFLTIKYFGLEFNFIDWDTSDLIDLKSKTNTWLPISMRSTVPVGTTILQAGAELSYDDTCEGSVFWDDLVLRTTSL
ncbi:MAG: hypothetical protein AAGA48_17120 [Myxococcota bacterium]